MYKNWILKSNKYIEERHLGEAPIYTLGNGFIGCRGFFEEQQEGIAALGGIYMAGVFGKAHYKAWKGDGHELVNTPNFLYVSINIDGELVQVTEDSISDFDVSLNIKDGTLKRSYVWKGKKDNKVKIEFERFVSFHNIYKAGQKIKVTPIDCNPKVEIVMGINEKITNLNYESCEPLPIQPGKKQMDTVYKDSDIVKVVIPIPEVINIVEKQFITIIDQESLKDFTMKTEEKGKIIRYSSENNKTVEIEKMVIIATSLECSDECEIISRLEDSLLSYSEELKLSINKLHEKWNTSDVKIEGNDNDALTIRYNIFQLMAACPEHTSKYSIGARGLTGEMYEGSVFWDTEIFMVPFFSLTNPKAARNLLEFRYNTLPEARLHAESNYFKGAMYGWQVNEKGVEQTPAGVGAYYSIHVIADITYAILDYWNVTQDEDFMVNYGCEILVETARYWESRVCKDINEDKYHILAVRGPNEYDVLVNNNLYTNIMARENLRLAIDFIKVMKNKYSNKWLMLKEKLSFEESECEVWRDIIDKIILPYNEEMSLYLEDDTYLQRIPVDMKKIKPTAKRVIDTTIPYEALPLYQITKQADVLHAMKNLPWLFTKEQIENAWDFYLPKTAFDSSLAYSMHSLMGARLGYLEEGHRYFDLSANLDLRDVQLNTISGLHFANFGGTWQAAIFGFGGVSVNPNNIEINPNLPDSWNKLEFTLCYRGGIFDLVVNKDRVEIETRVAPDENVEFNIRGKEFKIIK